MQRLRQFDPARDLFGTFGANFRQTQDIQTELPRTIVARLWRNLKRGNIKRSRVHAII